MTEALRWHTISGTRSFAHSGEEELDRMMGRFGERFEHNRHALRIVESFEHPYARFPGLNLTFEVREGIVKHSRDFEPGEFPDLDEYLPGLKPPLEAQLIDLCDEIAYNTADLDDGYSAGLVAPRDAAGEVTEFGQPWEAAEMQRFPARLEAVKVTEVVRGLINWLVTGLIAGMRGGGPGSHGVGGYSPASGSNRADSSAPAAAGTQELKRFLRQNVHSSEAAGAIPQRVRGENSRAVPISWTIRNGFPPHTARMPRTSRFISACAITSRE